ncbi:unnamed protein product [Thelazia callipaeda]|uniref:Uncharacterized protein n=1 Tax=Thelazia callipaeda TaxID=103827 RepID=A0A0N5CM90_THECL|nr:unnamed protein product [Thelazia callipaeda]
MRMSAGKCGKERLVQVKGAGNDSEVLQECCAVAVVLRLTVADDGSSSRLTAHRRNGKKGSADGHSITSVSQILRTT